MARKFVSASSQAINFGQHSALAINRGWSVVGRVYLDVLDIDQAILSRDTGSDYIRVQGSTNCIQLLSSQVATVLTGDTALTVGQWYSFCVIVDGDDNTFVWTGDADSADIHQVSDTTAETFDADADQWVGRDGANNEYGSLRICDVAKYDGILTSDDFALFVKGAQPNSTALSLTPIWYARLLGSASPETSVIGGYTGTLQNAPTQAQHPILFHHQNATNSGYQTASSYSFNAEVIGPEVELIVGVAMLSVGGSSATGITFNGVALTKRAEQSSAVGAIRAEMWTLSGAAVGTHSVSVTLSTTVASVAGAVAAYNVHQASPVEGVSGATATNVGAANAYVLIDGTAAGDAGVNVVATDDTSIGVTGVSGLIPQEVVNASGALGAGGMAVTFQKMMEGNSNEHTPGWSGIAALKTWSIVGMALRPVTAAALASGAAHQKLSAGLVSQGVLRGGLIA